MNIKCLCKALLEINRVMHTCLHASIHLYISHAGLLEMNLLKNRPEFSAFEHSSAWLYQAHASLHSLLVDVHTQSIFFFFNVPFLSWELSLDIPLFKIFQTSNQQAEIMCELCDPMPCHKFLPCFWFMTNHIESCNCLNVNTTLCISRVKMKVLELEGNFRVQRTRLHSSLHLLFCRGLKILFASFPFLFNLTSLFYGTWGILMSSTVKKNIS